MLHTPARYIFGGLVLAALALILAGAVSVAWVNATAPDSQCTTTHQTSSQPPASLQSAADYYQQANYDYDIGDCQRALADYTRSIELNPRDPRIYNDRAYTAMRMQKYAEALPDLNQALALRPDYVQALMNRGDLYNYYGPIIDRRQAIRDYDKVIALGATRSTSVCGHRFLAAHDGWSVATVFDLLTGGAWRSCSQ